MPEDDDTLTNLTPVEQPAATVEAAPAEMTVVTATSSRTDWGPPSAGRYIAALVIVLAMSAAAAFVVWKFWGDQIWNTITGDWT